MQINKKQESNQAQKPIWLILINHYEPSRKILRTHIAAVKQCFTPALPLNEVKSVYLCF